jgi:hypothetical protein
MKYLKTAAMRSPLNLYILLREHIPLVIMVGIYRFCVDIKGNILIQELS